MAHNVSSGTKWDPLVLFARGEGGSYVHVAARPRWMPRARWWAQADTYAQTSFHPQEDR